MIPQRSQRISLGTLCFFIYCYNIIWNYNYEICSDRADVILPAAKIFTSVMRWGNIKQIYVPQIGLADGLVNILYQRYKS